MRSDMAAAGGQHQCVMAYVRDDSTASRWLLASRTSGGGQTRHGPGSHALGGAWHERRRTVDGAQFLTRSSHRYCSRAPAMCLRCVVDIVRRHHTVQNVAFGSRALCSYGCAQIFIRILTPGRRSADVGPLVHAALAFTCMFGCLAALLAFSLL